MGIQPSGPSGKARSSPKHSFDEGRAFYKKVQACSNSDHIGLLWRIVNNFYDKSSFFTDSVDNSVSSLELSVSYARLMGAEIN
ncbi:MAG: hypothetical protein CSH36_08150 [Thalassolituus sp.]|jgi:hypothetical protein|nr:MAG: hypothetical protein CSH36_08150 [Thalassolituus sp.]